MKHFASPLACATRLARWSTNVVITDIEDRETALTSSGSIVRHIDRKPSERVTGTRDPSSAVHGSRQRLQ